MINLCLVRHGHTIWSDTGGVAGRTDIDLSDQGRAAVSAFARTVQPDREFTHWFCSPLKRTQETSEILRSIIATPNLSALPEVQLDERLVELDFGEWEGLTWNEVHENMPDLLSNWGEDWVNRSPPNGETFNEQNARCQSWLNDWLENVNDTSGASAMVVAHGGTIRALVCQCLGWDLRDAMTFNVDPSSLCWLQRENSEVPWQIKMINSQRA